MIFRTVVIVSFVGYDFFGIAVYGRSGDRHYGNCSWRDRVIVGRAEHEIVVGEIAVCQRAVGDNIAAGIHLFAESAGGSVPGQRGARNGVAVNHTRQGVFDAGIGLGAVFVSISAGHGDGQSLCRYGDVLIGQQLYVIAAVNMGNSGNVHYVFAYRGICAFESYSVRSSQYRQTREFVRIQRQRIGTVVFDQIHSRQSVIDIRGRSAESESGALCGVDVYYGFYGLDKESFA